LNLFGSVFIRFGADTFGKTQIFGISFPSRIYKLLMDNNASFRIVHFEIRLFNTLQFGGLLLFWPGIKVDEVVFISLLYFSKIFGKCLFLLLGELFTNLAIPRHALYTFVLCGGLLFFNTAKLFGDFDSI